MVVISLKGGLNTEVQNVTPLLLEEKTWLDIYKPLATFLSTDQYVTLFHVSFFEDIFFHIYH
jgi:hypothetical protein